MKRKSERFFIIAPIELVDDLENEIVEAWPFLLDETGRPCLDPLILEKFVGGIEIECRPIFAFQMNRILKIASRILWRKRKIKAREIFQLESQLKSTPWSEWIPAGKKIKFSIAASESKTNNEKKIHAILSKLLSKKFQIVDEAEDFHFYLRHHQNEMTISLDTSGDHLHKRSLSVYKTEAPIRETLAAAALREMLADISSSELRSITWLDPMAGSGTHGAELLDYNSLSPRTNFSFFSFTEVPKILKSESFWLNHLWAAKNNFKNIILADQNPKAMQALRKNFTQSEGNIIILERDLFLMDSRASYSLSRDEKLFVIVNPPYGERLGLTEPCKELSKILDHCWQTLKPQRLGFWSPVSAGELKLDAKLIKRKKIKNGGLPVYFSVWDL